MYHEAEGAVKEMVGSVAGNPVMEAKGQEKIAGKVQNKIGQIEKNRERLVDVARQTWSGFMQACRSTLVGRFRESHYRTDRQPTSRSRHWRRIGIDARHRADLRHGGLGGGSVFATLWRPEFLPALSCCLCLRCARMVAPSSQAGRRHAGISVVVYPPGFIPEGATKRQPGTPAPANVNGQVGRGR